MRTLWHHLTHRHVHYARDGHGVVVACSWRLPRASVALSWQPTGRDDWLEIPADRLTAWLDAEDQVGRLEALRDES